MYIGNFLFFKQGGVVMIEYILMGTKKHGCSIDNRKKEIIYYQLLSLYEKILKNPSNY